MQMQETVAIFGGSFDPPHLSHVLAATCVLSSTSVDRMLVVPTWKHPLRKRSHASFEHRLRMCELAMGDLKRVEISDIERELGGYSYTVRTLETLQTRWPNASFRLVLGADLVPETPKWHAFDRISEIAAPIVVGRKGTGNGGGISIELPPVSSTEIRASLRQGNSSLCLVPKKVLEYIAEHDLYTSEPDSEDCK